MGSGPTLVGTWGRRRHSVQIPEENTHMVKRTKRLKFKSKRDSSRRHKRQVAFLSGPEVVLPEGEVT